MKSVERHTGLNAAEFGQLIWCLIFAFHQTLQHECLGLELVLHSIEQRRLVVSSWLVPTNVRQSQFKHHGTDVAMLEIH